MMVKSELSFAMAMAFEFIGVKIKSMPPCSLSLRNYLVEGCEVLYGWAVYGLKLILSPSTCGGRELSVAYGC